MRFIRVYTHTLTHEENIFNPNSMHTFQTPWLSHTFDLCGPAYKCVRSFSIILTHFEFCTHTNARVCMSVAPTWFMCTEHFGMTSLRCRDIRSNSWLTRNEGGRALTPPRGIVINSRQMGQRNDPVSRVWEAAILDRQCKHTVCEHGSNFGVCSLPSYIPA